MKQGRARACDKIEAVSLYRTWRPKSFSDLVGQDAVVRTLRTALTSGKLAHAYLFSGPRGSGKTSAAKILARCIDCERGPTPEPDNTCDNCKAMLAGTALDVVEIDAASNRGIDEIRALRDAAKFAPASMRMKVFIIDEAHMLTREGANAFLKTLEEPPPHVVFVLATTAPESLPPTILSRCQRYAFRRIPVSVMVDRMREISAAEHIAADEDALAAIAYRADGGLRDALTMLEQVAAYAGPAGSPISAATVDAAFGITGRHFARQLVDAVLGAHAADALRVVDAASDAGADMLGLIRGTIGEYRNLMVARVDAELLSRDLAESDAAAAMALAAATPQPKIVRGLRLLADALAAGRLSGNPRLELETAVLRLVIATEDPTLEALSARLALLEGGPVPFTSSAASPAPPASTAKAAKPAAQPAKRAVEPAVASASATSSAAEAPVTAEIFASPRAEISETPRAAESPAGDDRTGDANDNATVIPPPIEAPAPAPIEAPTPAPIRTPAPAPTETRAATIETPAATVEPKPVTSGESVTAVSAAPPQPSAQPSLQQVRSLWDQIRLRAEEVHKPMRTLLARATVDDIADAVLTIGVPDSIQESLLRAKLDVVEAAIEAVVRTPVRVVLRSRLTAGTPRVASSANASRATAAPESGAPESASSRGGSTIASANGTGSASDAGGEFDLMAYARKKLGGTE